MSALHDAEIAEWRENAEWIVKHARPGFPTIPLAEQIIALTDALDAARRPAAEPVGGEATLRAAVEAVIASWSEAPSIVSPVGEWQRGWLRATEQGVDELRALLAAHKEESR